MCVFWLLVVPFLDGSRTFKHPLVTSKMFINDKNTVIIRRENICKEKRSLSNSVTFSESIHLFYCVLEVTSKLIFISWRQCQLNTSNTVSKIRNNIFINVCRYKGTILLYCWVDDIFPMHSLHSYASSTIFWVFGITRSGIEPKSTGPLVNTLRTRPMMVQETWVQSPVMLYQIL